MELILIGGLVGLIVGVGLTVLHFSFAKFFAVQARALADHEKRCEQLVQQKQKEQLLQTTSGPAEGDASQKRGIEAAAKAGE